jgi:biofilm PGA synthesis protein PgaA
LVPNKKIWTLGSAYIVALICCVHTSCFAATDTDYDAIIELARKGAFTQSLESLRAWQQSHPQDVRVVSDLVVVLGWSRDDAKAVEVAKAAGMAALTPYAVRNAAKSARNLQDHTWALQAYRYLEGKDAQDCDALIGVANSLVDLRQSEQADKTLLKLEAGCANAAAPWPDRVAQARTYWASRLNNNVAADPAALGWWMEQFNPQVSLKTYSQPYTDARWREAILLALRTGSHNLVAKWLPQGESALSDNDRARVMAALAAQKIRWAATTPSQERATWDQLLSAALKQLAQALALAKDPQLVRAIMSDMMTVYVERGNDAQALALMQEADSKNIVLLNYAELAVSDALMRDNQPAKAEQRLQVVLKKLENAKEFERRDANISLYYALLDQGKYQQARQLIETTTQQVPAFTNKGVAGVQVENGDYVRFQLARASMVSSGHDGREYNRSSHLRGALLSEAPFNTSIRLDEAQWLQARGWPRASAQVTELVLIDQPDNLRALEITASQALDAGDFQRYREVLGDMMRLGAHPLQLKRLKESADRQMGFLLSGDFTKGKSSSAASDSGSSDREAGFTLFSPVYQNHWRMKARWRNSQASLKAQEPHTDFAAMGLRMYWPYVWVDVELTKRMSPSAPVGLKLASHWQASDGLSLSASAATRSEELPLRGQVALESAKSAQVSLDWRALAQTYVGLSAGTVKSTDGNTRSDLGAYADQAFTLADSLQANVRLDLGQTTNTKSGVAYYSPKKLGSYSATTTFTHWIKQSGQYSWLHKLALGAGEISQQDYATASSYALSYEHEWRLGPARTLSAALGQSRRPYDGVQDRRRTFSLRWSQAL